MTNTMAGSSDDGILEQLQALDKTWCTEGGSNPNNNSKASDGEASVDPQLVEKQQKRSLTPLEKARDAIKSAQNSTTTKSIVSHLFSALHESHKDPKGEKVATPSSSQTPPPTEMEKNNSTQQHEYELRQLEWHVVLVLELLCASESKDGSLSKPVVLDALSSAIALYREEQSRQKTKKLDKKKKKKRRKKSKKDPSPTILSENQKEALLLGHLVDVLSRVPFLLPRDVPLSRFLNNRILGSNKLFWERLPPVVSHIYQSFEIPNPHLKKKGGEGRSLLLGSSVYEPMDSTAKTLPGEKEKKEIDSTYEATTKKRKEKLQALAKNKKRQRLASLTTSKKKHRGSHFHRNLDDISKLLDKKKHPKPTLSANATRGKSTIATTLKERKSSSNNLTATNRRDRFEKADPLVQKKLGRQDNNKSHKWDKHHEMSESQVRKSQGQSKRPFKPTDVRKQTSIDDLLADPSAGISQNKRKNTNRNTSDSRGSSCITDALTMTPRKSVRSNETSRIIGETPVPTGTGRQTQTVVGETPVATNRSRAFQAICGETPTYENTPISSSSSTPACYQPPLFSPPVLPSPTKLPTPCAEESTTKQPVKLFGLLKRTNSIGSRGGRMNNNKNSAQGLSEKNGGKRKSTASTSSIDKALSFLRSKTL